MVEISIIKIIGVIFLIFAGYLGFNYRHSGFNEELFFKWEKQYRKCYPDFDQDEAEEWLRKNPTGAPSEIWGKAEYLKQLDLGKAFAWFFGSLGAILTSFFDLRKNYQSKCS